MWLPIVLESIIGPSVLGYAVWHFAGYFNGRWDNDA